MKKRFIVSVNLILLAIISSCQPEEKIESVTTINIADNIKKMEKIYLSDMVDSIWYIPMESNIEYPLLFIDPNQLEISDQYIFAADNASCNLYDLSGKFIRKIGKKGRGPGEYSFINGVALTNDKIYIRDLYDLSEFTITGEFIKKYLKCFLIDDVYLKDIYFLNDSLILAYIDNPKGNTEDKAVIINKSGEVIQKFKNYIIFNLEPGVTDSRGVANASFYRFSNQLVYKDPYNDTLFNLNEKCQLIPSYVSNLGKYKEPPSNRGKPLDSGYSQNSNFISVNSIFQTDNYLFLDCNLNNHFPAKRINPEIIPLPTGMEYIRQYNTQAALGIFDKKKRTIIFSEPTSTDNKLYTSGLYNDFDAGPRFFPDKQLDDSTMIMIVAAKDLKSHIASEDFKKTFPKFPEKKMELENLSNIISEYDNPVLMFVRFSSK